MKLQAHPMTPVELVLATTDAIADVEVEGVVVGTCAYHGPPRDGLVEVGCSVVPAYRRRGIATEATRRLIERAWERGVRTIRASTLVHPKPSIGVLRKLGSAPAPPAGPGVVAFELSRSDG